MARDGTNRGGARPGAGRPRKALTEKIAEGKSAEVMMQPADIESAETPPVRDFMKELQRDGTKLLADDVYIETYQWLKERSCEKIVSRQLVEQYAMSISRWIHCEQIVTKYGYISKHPNGCGDRLSLCSDVTELHETGKSDLESDFSDCEGKLFCGISGQSAGRYDGKAAPQQKVSIYESR